MMDFYFEQNILGRAECRIIEELDDRGSTVHTSYTLAFTAT